jgi:polyphosphate glucokinase
MNALVIDIGGTHVKILATGQKQFREFPSGPTLSAKQMVGGVKKLARDWKYDVLAIGYPGLVVKNRPLAQPYNLGRGWIGFNFKAAFNRPVRVVNDAAMQALGSYKGGKMLFLGLGTGLGSAMIVDGMHDGTHGAWPSAVQEKHVRRLRRGPRIRTVGQKEKAACGRGCGCSPHCRSRTR